MHFVLTCFACPRRLGRGTCVLASSHHSARVTTKSMFIVIAPCECDDSDDLGSYQTAVRYDPRRPRVVPVNNFALTWVWDNISHHSEDPGQGDLGSYPRRVRGRPRLHNTSHFSCEERITTTNTVTLLLLGTTWHSHYDHNTAVGYDPTQQLRSHFDAWKTFFARQQVMLLLLGSPCRARWLSLV